MASASSHSHNSCTVVLSRWDVEPPHIAKQGPSASELASLYDACEIHSLRHALHAQHAPRGARALEQPVVVTVFDEDYAPFYAPFRAMCARYGLSYGIALHLGSAQEVARRRYPPNAVVHSPALSAYAAAPPEVSLKNNRHGRFYGVGRLKTLFVAMVVRLGFAPMVVELDVIFFKNPLPLLAKHLPTPPLLEGVATGATAASNASRWSNASTTSAASTGNASLVTMFCRQNNANLRINLGLQLFAAPISSDAVEFISLVAYLAIKRAAWDQEEFNDTCWMHGASCIFGARGHRLPLGLCEICHPKPQTCAGARPGPMSCRPDPRFSTLYTSREDDAIYSSGMAGQRIRGLLGEATWRAQAELTALVHAIHLLGSVHAAVETTPLVAMHMIGSTWEMPKQSFLTAIR